MSFPLPSSARLPLPRIFLVAAALLAVAFAGCAAEPSESDADDADVEVATEAISARRRGPLQITPGMRWLRSRSERELGEIFARGTADEIPLGANNGAPILPGAFSALEPIAVVLYQGSVWAEEVDASGRPIVTVRDKFLRDGRGGLVTYFEGRVFRARLAEVDVGAPPPRGTIRPYALSPFKLAIETDDRPSLFVDYSGDRTPFVNRILDEIREVDHARCPGLYLGRAHFLRDRLRGSWSYLYWFALDFGGPDRPCSLR